MSDKPVKYPILTPEVINNYLQKVAEKIYVDNIVQEQRSATCNSCEFFFAPTTTCKKCGCFMPLKSKLKDVHCPIRKW